MKYYLEFCIKQNADLIRNIVQFLKLVASCNLLLLAKINLLTIQFRELALEHEFMLLFSLLALVETDSLVIGDNTTLPVENIHRNLTDSLFLLDVDVQNRNYNFLRHTATMYESASRTLFADSVQPFGSLYFRIAF